MNFGARMAALAALVPEHTVPVDVGTDHAYLPVLLAQSGKVKKAIAADIAAGPCEAAAKTLQTYGLEQVIEIRQGDGLTVVRPGEVDTAILAGMGAATMVNIFAAVPALVKPGQGQLSWLVLQPMSDSPLLRHWAEAQGWGIVQENLVQEAGKIYEILLLKPQPGYCYPGVSYEIGDYLVKTHHPLLLPFLAKHIEKYAGLLAVMEKSPVAAGSAKYRAYQQHKKQLEVLYYENNGN